jgi:hypothetical protein
MDSEEKLEDRVPPGRSFVIGCLIGLCMMLVISLGVLTYGRQAALNKARETRELVTIVAKHIRTVRSFAPLPRADGSGSDYSGQEALSQARFKFPKSMMIRGLACDVWKQPLRYRCLDGRTFLLYSCGPNGRDDQGEFDDIAER